MSETLVTKEQFLSDVMTEINTLKAIATPEEINKLDFYRLEPSRADQCIYGQMTGSCTSERAKALMDKACVRVMNIRVGISVNQFQRCYLDEDFEEIQSQINGENTGQGWNDEGGVGYDSRNYDHLSMVEAYIMFKDAKNEEIIQYLKGEIDTLIL